MSAPNVLRVGLTVAAVLIPVQIFVGDLHGLNTLEHQPAKIAAMEGIWHTERGAPLLLFAWPDDETRRNEYAIEAPIPGLAAFILTHDFNAPGDCRRGARLERVTQADDAGGLPVHGKPDGGGRRTPPPRGGGPAARAKLGPPFPAASRSGPR